MQEKKIPVKGLKIRVVHSPKASYCTVGVRFDGLSLSFGPSCPMVSRYRVSKLPKTSSSFRVLFRKWFTRMMYKPQWDISPRGLALPSIIATSFFKCWSKSLHQCFHFSKWDILKETLKIPGISQNILKFYKILQSSTCMSIVRDATKTSTNSWKSLKIPKIPENREKWKHWPTCTFVNLYRTSNIIIEW